MKKKVLRLLALVLCSILALSVLIACDGGNDEIKDGGADNENIFAVKYNGTTVTLGKKADSVLSKLGEPTSKQNTGNCGGKGETVRYDYSSLTLVVVNYTDGDKIIDQIELRNDGAETSKGIYIGSDEADVKEAYGEPDSKKNGVYTYTEGDKSLEITVSDGAVESIVFRCIEK